MDQAFPDPVRAVIEGDFAQFADSFANAGFAVRLPARGVLQLGAPGRFLKRPRLLISAGVHGDETAPIEMVARLVGELSRTPSALAVDLMVVVGNLAAIAQGKRYVEGDLNRMFTSDRGALQSTPEAERADAIMRATASFFGGLDADKWHFDLHTAIRPSHYPTFAVVPDVIAPMRKQNLFGWLGQAGIGAVILNTRPAGTFSAYTAHMFEAASATVELGQVSKLGSNDLSRFADAYSALDVFLRTGRPPVAEAAPQVFKVAQELVKHTDDFRMSFDDATQNFTAMAPGTLLAEDGEVIYRVGPETEYVVFPNPGVRPGLRAGLMVVRDPA